jgi:hypothetical protein
MLRRRKAAEKRMPCIAVYTTGRLAFADTQPIQYNAIAALGIPLVHNTGVFWNLCMERLFDAVIEANAQYILAVDQDSVFDAYDVAELLRLGHEHPEANAICHMQMRREANVLLAQRLSCNAGVDDPLSLDCELTPIDAGHFGCTLLQVDCVKAMPKPWFLEQRGEDGSISPGNGGCHPDIYFWRKWKEHGYTLFQANTAPLGHLELAISWPGRDGQTHRQYVADYLLHGRPPECWRYQPGDGSGSRAIRRPGE